MQCNVMQLMAPNNKARGCLGAFPWSQHERYWPAILSLKELMGSIQTHSCRNCLAGAWRWRICKQYFPWKMIPLSSPYIPSWKHTNSSGIIWKKSGSSMAVSNFDLQSWKPITFDHELIGKVLNGGHETRVSAIVVSKFDIVSFGYKQTAVYFTIRLYSALARRCDFVLATAVLSSHQLLNPSHCVMLQ
jgi:hypothetical protein